MSLESEFADIVRSTAQSVLPDTSSTTVKGRVSFDTRGGVTQATVQFPDGSVAVGQVEIQVTGIKIKGEQS